MEESRGSDTPLSRVILVAPTAYQTLWRLGSVAVTWMLGFAFNLVKFWGELIIKVGLIISILITASKYPVSPRELFT